MDLSSISLRSKRLLLTAFVPTDAPEAFAGATPTLSRYMGWDPAPSLEAFEQIWRSWLPMMVAGTDVPIAVRLASTHEFLGMAGLHHVDVPEGERCRGLSRAAPRKPEISSRSLRVLLGDRAGEINLVVGRATGNGHGLRRLGEQFTARRHSWICAAKQRHKGMLWGMYVRAQARGTGLAAALVQQVAAHARPLVEQVCLTVVASNAAARRLYGAAGFEEYGLEQRALKVGTEYYDEVLMVLPLNARPEAVTGN
jgi:RimJ/RimL family protein N-acetyltransferase